MQTTPKAGPAAEPECHGHAADSVTRRLVYALALLPIVPAASFIGAYVCDTYLPLGAFDDIRWFHLLFAVLWVVATIAIWRSVITWTLGRKWLTVLVSLIPFVQVAFAQPLWNAGCVDEDILRIGQHEIGIGTWVWLTIWVWWVWEKRTMSRTDTDESPRPIRMTPNARRLAASIGSIPFVFGVFLIIGIAFDDLLGLGEPGPETFAAAAIIAIQMWILIWRRAVAWSPLVIRETVLTALVCFGLPIAAQFIFWDQASGLSGVALGCAPVIGWGIWMGTTIGSWPVVGAVHAATSMTRTPRCINCGYLLIGLRSTRCPECGNEPTLDELWDATATAV